MFQARALLAITLLALPLFAADKPTPPADLAAPPADAERTADGLVTKKLADGTGTAKPSANDIARLRYTVWKQDGTLVQDVPAPRSVVLPMVRMIAGWREAVEMMVTGEQRRAWIPAALSDGKVKEGESVIIDTELVEIIKSPPTPADVAAPPDDATKTASGLAYKVLHAGSGDVHPRRYSTVVVHYSGWTTDGALFDSSVMRGQPAEFALDAVIPGWTEGLQLMVKGEKARFWIPSTLAYGNDKSKPQGMLVFDVELLEIK